MGDERTALLQIFQHKTFMAKSSRNLQKVSFFSYVIPWSRKTLKVITNDCLTSNYPDLHNLCEEHIFANKIKICDAN